jgi:hypothetical protein
MESAWVREEQTILEPFTLHSNAVMVPVERLKDTADATVLGALGRQPVSLRRTWDDVERDMSDAHGLTCSRRPTEDMVVHVCHPGHLSYQHARSCRSAPRRNWVLEQLPVIAVNKGYPSLPPNRECMFRRPKYRGIPVCLIVFLNVLMFREQR